MPTGNWFLCETKPKRVLYANQGRPNCPCVVYRVSNAGPAAVIAGGAIHLDPGEDGDIAGPEVDVALAGKPLCPPGASGDDQMAKGTYELLCDCCCCDGGAGDAQTLAGGPPIIDLKAKAKTTIVVGSGAAKAIELEWNVSGGNGTVTVKIDLEPNSTFPHPRTEVQPPIMARQGSCGFPNTQTQTWAAGSLPGPNPVKYVFTATVTDSSTPPQSSKSQVQITV